MIVLLFLFIKNLFSFIDRMVVFVIKYLYQLIVAIADTNVFGDLIYRYLGRIYMFLSVFMVFKLSISVINYIINPDSMTDKSKGFGKLITNVVISLILLAVTPNLFNAAYNLQTDLLNSNAVYQIVTGRALPTNNTRGDDTTLYDNAKYSAEQIAFGVFSGFVYQVPDEDSDDPSQGKEFGAYCEEKSVKNGCGKEVKGETIPVCTNTTCLLDADTVTDKNNKYWWLISTACGCVVAYILLGFCIDTAVRSVKLGFLQIIAPIPIMLRMDPNAKDDKFQKWLQETIKTFVSLFIRLAALFFAVEIINTVMNPPEGLNAMTSYSGANELGGGGLTGVFVKIFIIIGCLLFAKQFPQLLSDILGIKLDGDGFSLKKKMAGVPGLGAAKMIGAGALGFAGGAAANAYAGIKGWDKTKGFWRNANHLGNSMATGAFSGAFRGARSNEKNMFKAAGAGIGGSVNARNLRIDRNATGDGGIKGWASRRVAGLDKFAGVTNDDTAKIAAQRQFGEDLWNKVNSKEKGYESKYAMGGNIGSEFGKAWKTADDAKDYRNKINSQLSMARSDFQAGKDIEWEGKTGAAAIAALEVESAKASAAYDKATADFKELRSMQEHKSEATYYDAYNAADDRHSAQEYSEKTVTEYSSSSSKNNSSGPTVGGVPVSEPNQNGERTTAGGIVLPSGVKIDK